MQSNKKIADWALYIMMSVTIAVIALFFLGGVKDPAAEMVEYTFTDPLLYWSYVLTALGTLSIFIFSIGKFAIKLKENPKAALTSMIEFAILGVMLFVTWSLGSGQPLDLPGYEGTDNIYFWLKWGDMLLFTTYILLGTAIATMVFFNVAKFVKR
ncbi:MAG: hypothetical protein PHV20_01285 [Bacteroidales bacterium]|nr:hypothetical protein [Bacteroidales bacterium]